MSFECKLMQPQILVCVVLNSGIGISTASSSQYRKLHQSPLSLCFRLQIAKKTLKALNAEEHAVPHLKY